MQELSAPEEGVAHGPGRTAGSPTPVLTAVAWRARPDMSFAEWIEQGRKLGVIGRSAGWWIGDWLRYGSEAYGERYVRAARVTGYDVQTLMNMVYVASHIEPSRRREKLSWSHHAEVVAQLPEEQDRWLARAEADRLSVRCLRDAVRRERRARDEIESGPSTAHTQQPSPDAPPAEDAHLTCPSCGHSFPGAHDVPTGADARAGVGPPVAVA